MYLRCAHARGFGWVILTMQQCILVQTNNKSTELKSPPEGVSFWPTGGSKPKRKKEGWMLHFVPFSRVINT